MVPSRVEARQFRRRCASSFEGVTLQALAAEPGLPVRARWSIEADGASEAVVYAQEDGESWTVLTSKDEGLAFQYADSAGQWHGHWPIASDDGNPPRERIPRMIRLVSTAAERCGSRAPTSFQSPCPTTWRTCEHRAANSTRSPPRPHGPARTHRSVPRARGELPGGALNTSGRNAEGFVLVATLWVLAALAVLAAYIDGVVATDVERAVETRGWLASELDRRSTEATLIYLLSTGRMSYRGLILEEEQRFTDALSDDQQLPDHGDGELRLAGEVYAGLGGTRFSVQDEVGLASVNAPTSSIFAALLEHAGVAESDVERIVARVEDYIDSDDTLTLNGAERYDYSRFGEPPPLNWIMSSPQELSKVLGVGELFTPAQWDRLWPVLTMRPIFGYNFNTMRPEILAALLDLDAQGIRGVLEERERRSISRMTTVALLSGRHLDIDEMEIRTLPSQFLRISIWHESDGSRILTGIHLTPLGATAPWRKDYRYLEPIRASHDSGTPRETPPAIATALLQ